MRAAQRTGQFAGAEVAAGLLAAATRTDLGDHPHTGLAVELHAQSAADARHWNHAALLHIEAAVLRHRLGSRGETEAALIRQAVAAWLHACTRTSQTTPDVLKTGIDLAHTLICLCPHQLELAAVLRRLAEHLPPGQRPTHPDDHQENS